MGLSNNAATIIEFNGLPGIGKTTLANELISQLQQDGYTCSKSFYKHNYQKRFVDFTVLFQIDRLILAVKLICNCIRLGNIRDRLSCINAVLRYVRMYQQFHKQNSGFDFLIIDQGIVQGILSVFHKDAIPDKKSIWNIIRSIPKGFNIIIINCINQPDLANKRIIERKNSGGRLDVMEDISRKETLQVQTLNGTVLREMFDEVGFEAINVETANTPYSNACMIKEIITK